MSTATVSGTHSPALTALADSRPVAYPQIITEPPPFAIETLQDLLDGEQKPMRDRVNQILRQPHFRYYDGTDTGWPFTEMINMRPCTSLTG